MQGVRDLCFMVVPWQPESQGRIDVISGEDLTCQQSGTYVPWLSHGSLGVHVELQAVGGKGPQGL